MRQNYHVERKSEYSWIDIAKKKFDVCLLIETQSYQSSFSNSIEGLPTPVLVRASRIKALHACLEATGVYYEALAEYLCQPGYTVVGSIFGRSKLMLTVNCAGIKLIAKMPN